MLHFHKPVQKLRHIDTGVVICKCIKCDKWYVRWTNGKRSLWIDDYSKFWRFHAGYKPIN